MADRAPLSTLSSLLAAQGVTTRAIEEAISKQVVLGSDLATNLLDVGGVSEELLLKVLAEASGLPPAPLGSLAPPMHTALALVSADVANRENILPFTLVGTLLTLIVAEPLVSPDQLGFGTKITVNQVIAPLPRIRQAISKAYRIPLDKRFTRLIGKMGEPSASSSRFDIQDEPTQVSGIPLIDLGIVRPATQTPATLAAGGSPATVTVPLPIPAPVAPVKPAPAPAPARVSDADGPVTAPPGGMPKSVGEHAAPQTIPGDVALAKGNAPAWAARAPIVQVVEPPAGWRPLTSDDMPETIPAPRLAAMGGKPGGSPLSAPIPPTAAAAAPAAPKAAQTKDAKDDDAAPVSRRTAGLPKRETARGRAAGGLFRRAAAGEHKPREQQPAPQFAAEPPPNERRGSVRVRRKGPFTAPQAEEELAEATATDVVLDTLFSFAQQFFEYTVLFVVSGEMADGRDACGPGLTATQIKNIKFPLDQPSLLQLARDRKAPVTAPPVSHGVDVQIIRDLAREARFVDGYRSAVAVLPVVVRNRVVALLLGDDGHVDADLSTLGDVIIILGRTVEALERVILRKKLGAAGRSPSVFPPGTPTSDAPPPIEGLRPVGLAALARALEPASESEGNYEPEVSSLPPTKSAPMATLLSAAALRSTENPGFVVRHEQPDVIPRSSRQAAREGGTNRSDSTSSSSAPAADEDVPDPAAPSERSGPGSRRRRFLNGPNSRPRLAPVSSHSPESTLEVPQPTIQGMPRSQRRGAVTVGRPRAIVGPRPLPANLGATVKTPLRVPPGRNVAAESATPETLAGPPLPPTVQARRFGASPHQTNADKHDPATQQVQRETVALLQRFVESNGADDDAGQAIVMMGERAVAAIMARFPGPLAPGIERDAAVLPPASSCGPLLALLVAMGGNAVLQVAQRATSILAEDRFWAAHVLGEIPCSESVEVVGTMLFDDDLTVRRIARRASVQLVANVPEAGAIVAPMLEQAIQGSSARPGKRFIAFEALGELAIPSTIPALIELLEDSVQDVVEAVRRVLVQITCQDFGRDTQRWFDWFDANVGRHRIEWIIDALMHESGELRRIALDALGPVVGRDLGYDPYESREQRAAAHVQYMLWWEREGRVQFAQ